MSVTKWLPTTWTHPRFRGYRVRLTMYRAGGGDYYPDLDIYGFAEMEIHTTRLPVRTPQWFNVRELDKDEQEITQLCPFHTRSWTGVAEALLAVESLFAELSSLDLIQRLR